MPNSRRATSPRSGARHRVSIGQANAIINDLCKTSVPTMSGQENLDAPVDSRIRATRETYRYKLELVIGDQAVSNTAVNDFWQQIGSQSVYVGGIGGVGTHNDHRFNGYCRIVMDNSLRWMRQKGFHVAMLYGIASFYPKFGYAQAFPTINFTMAVRDAEMAEPTGYSFANFAPKYLKPVLKMYHQSNKNRTGPIVRDPKHWEPFRKGSIWDCKAVCKIAVDKQRKPIGYFVYDNAHLTATVTEVGYRDHSVFPDILRAIAKHALSQRLETIRFILPEDDAFIAYCHPLGIVKEVTYRKEGGGMVRLLNVPEALKAVSGELASRMCGSGAINILTNLDNVGMKWSRGKLTVVSPIEKTLTVRMPQWALAQLLYGFRTPESLVACGVCKLSKAALPILNDMFPVKPHFHYVADHF